MRWRDWWLRKHPNRSVQYEIHHMTHRGGWKRHWPSIYIPEPEKRPKDDENFWIEYPGRYRHIRRVDGRIDETLWTYETEDAQEWYEQQKREEQLEEKRERQRDQLQQMSFEEVKAEYFGDTDRLNLLDLDEIRERYDILRERHLRREPDDKTDDLSEEERKKLQQLKIINEELQKALGSSPSGGYPPWQLEHDSDDLFDTDTSL